MTPQQYLDQIAHESARFASLTADALDRPIPHLGDWSTKDLVAHLGRVYTMVIANTDAEAAPPDDPPVDDSVSRWFEAIRNQLIGTLGSADPDAPTTTFAGERTVTWWLRRMASETSVHRWDAEVAVSSGSPAAIDSDLAADGVDEYLEVSLRHSSSRPNRVYPEQSLHLHRSDGPGEWMLVGDGASGVTVTHEHGKGDAAVRGPASDLLLWVWGRPADDVEIFGDPAVAAAWQDLSP